MGPVYTATADARPYHRGPENVEPVLEQPVFTSYDYSKPIAALPDFKKNLFIKSGADWIHSGRYPLSQQRLFKMEHNFFDYNE